jgi:hypothetical protein
LCGCYLLKRLSRARKSHASVARLEGLGFYKAKNGLILVATNVTQNCGLPKRRFKLKSEARRA